MYRHGSHVQPLRMESVLPSRQFLRISKKARTPSPAPALQLRCWQPAEYSCTSRIMGNGLRPRTLRAPMQLSGTRIMCAALRQLPYNLGTAAVSSTPLARGGVGRRLHCAYLKAHAHYSNTWVHVVVEHAWSFRFVVDHARTRLPVRGGPWVPTSSRCCYCCYRQCCWR
eukprot:COSAG02_NODE_1341_length_13172_cov_324.630001_9_plen_169_part_00